MGDDCTWNFCRWNLRRRNQTAYASVSSICKNSKCNHPPYTVSTVNGDSAKGIVNLQFRFNEDYCTPHNSPCYHSYCYGSPWSHVGTRGSYGDQPGKCTVTSKAY